MLYETNNFDVVLCHPHTRSWWPHSETHTPESWLWRDNKLSLFNKLQTRSRQTEVTFKTGSGQSSAALKDPVEIGHIGDLQYRPIFGEPFGRHERRTGCWEDHVLHCPPPWRHLTFTWPLRRK